MGFALDHADLSSDVVQLINDWILHKDSPVPTRIARLYLISDILHNSSVPIPHASSYRKHFENKLPAILESFRDVYKSITGRITAENLKEQILRLIRIWEGWSLYPPTFIEQLNTSFLGSVVKEATNPDEEDIDGVPI